MNKQDFFTILREGLNDFPEKDLNDILNEYNESFNIGLSQGKTEEEILNSLDNPFMIINNYRNNYLPNKETTLASDLDNNEDYKKSNEDNNSNQCKSNNTSTTNTIKNNNNIILRIIIAALLLVLFGPFLIAAFGVAVGLIISLIAVPFSLLIGGSAFLVSRLGVKVIGFSIPPFLSDFPIDVAALITLGSLFATVLFIILAYYFIKLIVIWIKKLTSKNSNKEV